ncbi:hypothetical protein Ancab_031852 [Ancistrocladus abbreviatus]
MASPRVLMFVTEAAPPQLVNVTRQKASRVLETIHEEDRDGNSETVSPCSKSSSPSSPITPSSKYFFEPIKGNFLVFQALKYLGFKGHVIACKD